MKYRNDLEYIFLDMADNGHRHLMTDPSISTEASYCPVRELMRAIVLRAIEDLKKGGEVGEDARAFFEGKLGTKDENGDEYLFSFRSICSHLGFNPDEAFECIQDAIRKNRKISTRRRVA